MALFLDALHFSKTNSRNVEKEVEKMRFVLVACSLKVHLIPLT